MTDLKPEADKYREEQIEKLCRVMPSKPRANSLSYKDKKELARLLHDSGVIVVADDEYVCKALTDEQRHKIYSMHYTYNIQKVIDAVQREIGVK